MIVTVASSSQRGVGGETLGKSVLFLKLRTKFIFRVVRQYLDTAA